MFWLLALPAIDIEEASQLPLIAVGIDNGAMTDKSSKDRDDRANEYLPYPTPGLQGTRTR